MTIENFLQGKFEYQFSALNMQSTLVGRGIVPETSQADVSEKDTDLAQSDLYMILANVTGGSGKKITKGNRTVSEKSFSFGITDRDNYRNEAIRLRAKWGEVATQIPTVKFARLFDRR